MKHTLVFVISTLFSLLGVNNFALGAKWDDPGIQVQFSGRRFHDQLGRTVNIDGMPDDMRQSLIGASPTPSGGNNNTQQGGNNTQQGGGNNTQQGGNNTQQGGGNNTQQGGGNNTQQGGNNTQQGDNNNNASTNAAATTKKGFSVSAGQVAGAIGGGAMVASTLLGNEEHGVGGIVTGVLGGTTAGASLGGPWGALAGAVAGGLISGSQMFSETDCMRDPETNVFTCCNTAFNKGQRQVEIGGYMFCTEEIDGQLVAKRPYVRQCLQGGSDKPASWWDGLWKDDGWSPECVVRFCNGEPPAGVYNLEYTPDLQNFCYTWSIPAGAEGAAGTDPYVIVKQKIESQIQQLQSQCGNLL